MLRPFSRFCVRIGAVPPSIIKSLSYEEQLIRLVKFLKEQVVPAIDDNADAIEELQTAMVQLENYVNNYFDNLDVQEEIDNKLDQMVQDGTIKSLLNNELLTEINEKVLQNTVDISANTEAIDNKVSYNEASSISMEMLNQEVREALTGGSTAVVGTDSVDTVNIADKAVTILKLDDYLQATKIMESGEPMALGTKAGGIAKENTSTHKIEINSPTSTDYSWYKVALTKGKYYYFTGYNYGPVGFYIADSEDNVIFNSVTNPSSYSMTPYSTLIRANASGLYAYIDIKESYYASTWRSITKINTPLLREVSSIENKVKKIEAQLVKKVDDGYLDYRHVSGANLPIYDNYTDPNHFVNTKIYQMSKGVKYHVEGYKWSYVCGIYILGLDNQIIYQSNDETPDDKTLVTYDFTASQDGFICVHEIDTSIGTVSVIQPFTDSPASSSELGFTKWIALGDSLTESNFRASSNYVDYIEEELGIDVVNLAHSGSGYKKLNTNNKSIITEIGEIPSYNYNTDIITVMGSINDFSYLANDLGELGDTTTDTLYGAMYVFFSTLQTTYMGTRLGVITPPVTGTNYSYQKPRFALYNKALKETAELFGVPVLDLTYSCNLKPWETNFRNEFYSADGTGGSGQVDDTHPNSKGHWLIHNKIKEFIKTL